MRYFGFDKTVGHIKRHGFLARANDAIATANFVTQEYTKGGYPCGFEDLFGFSRASKAWLPTVEALAEYDADVPRISDGLLLEPAATNYFPYSTVSNGTIVAPAERVGANAILFPAAGYGTYRADAYPPEGVRTISAYVISAAKPGIPGKWFEFYLGNQFKPPTVTSVGPNLWLCQATAPNGYPGYHGIYRQTTDNIDNAFTVIYMQVEIGSAATTPILTNGAATARAAETISLSVQGATTLAGDWDSSISITLVDGDITHTGAGKVRYLEFR